MPTVRLASSAGLEPITVDLATWGRLRALARRLGWRPTGTWAPPGVDPGAWLEAYDVAQGQRVIQPDARALAEALARAELDDLRPGDELVIAALTTLSMAGSYTLAPGP